MTVDTQGEVIDFMRVQDVKKGGGEKALRKKSQGADG